MKNQKIATVFDDGVYAKDFVEGEEYHGIPCGIFWKEGDKYYWQSVFNDIHVVTPHPSSLFKKAKKEQK